MWTYAHICCKQTFPRLQALLCTDGAKVIFNVAQETNMCLTEVVIKDFSGKLLLSNREINVVLNKGGSSGRSLKSSKIKNNCGLLLSA